MSIIKERLRLSSKDLMTALGSGQRNWARPKHTISLSAIWFFDSLRLLLGEGSIPAAWSPVNERAPITDEERIAPSKTGKTQVSRRRKPEASQRASADDRLTKFAKRSILVMMCYYTLMQIGQRKTRGALPAPCLKSQFHKEGSCSNMVTTKKILAWLCAAAMVLSAMAMPVFADAEVYDSDVHGAVCTERMHNGGVSDGAAVSVPTDQEASVSLMADGEIATVGGIGYTDLQEAVNAAQGTENAVEITSSIIQGTQVDITGAVIINGSGNMITADGTDTIFNLAAANAALTMNNLTITGVVPVTLGMDGQEVYLNDSAIQVVSRDGAYSRGIRMTNQDIVQDIVIRLNHSKILYTCLLYTSDAADE